MRRTKEEAEETRQAIMAAALRTFEERGISKTTLEHIALAAGVTRGAIYHHFVDKQAVLAAIREAVSLPLIDRADFTLLSDRDGDPLERVERFMLDLFRAIEEDATMRRAFAVMSFKCEYVGELEAELDEYVRKIVRTRNQLTEVYADAKACGDLRGCLSPELAALETTVFLAGLMRLCCSTTDGWARASMRPSLFMRTSPPGARLRAKVRPVTQDAAMLRCASDKTARSPRSHARPCRHVDRRRYT